MNKKVIIGIIAAILALALVIGGIFAVTSDLTFKNPDSDNSSSADNSSDSDNSSNSNESDESSTPQKPIGQGNKDTEINTNKNKDEILSLPIKLTNNEGSYAGNFIFTYDDKALTYVGYDKGEIFDEYMVTAKDGKISTLLNSSALEDTKKNGTLLVLKFKANKNAAAGSYKIELDRKESMLGSITEQLVTADISTGSITIK